jgi:hypothetical protein
MERQGKELIEKFVDFAILILKKYCIIGSKKKDHKKCQ